MEHHDWTSSINSPIQSEDVFFGARIRMWGHTNKPNIIEFASMLSRLQARRSTTELSRYSISCHRTQSIYTKGMYSLFLVSWNACPLHPYGRVEDIQLFLCPSRHGDLNSPCYHIFSIIRLSILLIEWLVPVKTWGTRHPSLGAPSVECRQVREMK